MPACELGVCFPSCLRLKPGVSCRPRARAQHLQAPVVGRPLGEGRAAEQGSAPGQVHVRPGGQRTPYSMGAGGRTMEGPGTCLLLLAPAVFSVDDRPVRESERRASQLLFGSEDSLESKQSFPSVFREERYEREVRVKVARSRPALWPRALCSAVPQAREQERAALPFARASS